MRTVLITGCSRGIGLTFARTYAKNGWRVIATSRKVSDDWSQHGVARWLPLDVTSDSSITQLVKELESEKNINLIINNAGVNSRSSLETLEHASFAKSFDVNVIGPTMVVKALLPLIRRTKAANIRPIIVSISSILGSIQLASETLKSTGMFDYSVSKAALNMASRLISLELKDDATVVTIHPGWVKTDMGGKMAPLTPDESVSAMVKVIETIGHEHKGTFLDYKGEAVPF